MSKPVNINDIPLAAMAQVFSQRTVLLIKLGLIAFPVLLAIAIYLWRAALPNATGAAVRQPIPFSHKHHAGDDGIDCRYCHSSVEKSRFAGLPSTEICLNCHSQLFSDAPLLAQLKESLAANRPIPWRRVNDLPDFVYFDHSIHVKKGVSCGECHGPVEQMPLTWRQASLEMQWCLDCHRSAEKHLHPAAEVFTGIERSRLGALERQALKESLHIRSVRRLTDCSTCHR